MKQRTIKCPHCGQEIIINEEEILQHDKQDSRKCSNKTLTFIILFLIATAICVTGAFFYHQTETEKEYRAYEYAIGSHDPLVLQNYLNTYQEAPSEHIDSIRQHLLVIQQMEQEWSNALVSRSESMMKQYLERYPDSPHKKEAECIIDSIDWINVTTANTEDAYNSYMEEHPNGQHLDEAHVAIGLLKDKSVTPIEAQMVKGIFRSFFQAVNARNEEGMLKVVCLPLNSFLNKQGAGKEELVTFMNKQWKENVANMNWHICDDDYQIEKKESVIDNASDKAVEGKEFEYSVLFTAVQRTDMKEPKTTRETTYHIKGHINAQGLITELNLSRVQK